MSKKDRRNILERLASRLDPAEHALLLQEQLKALKAQASRVMIAVEHLENDPHAQEVEQSQVAQGYEQLKSLLWRIEDIEARLDGLDKAHVISIGDFKNRAERRRLKNKTPQDLSNDDDSTSEDSNEAPTTDGD